MIRTVLWYFFFWLYQIVSLSFFIPLVLLMVLHRKRALDAFIYFLSYTWGRNIICMAGGRVTVTGLEHVPKQNNVCFVANHQGVFDIPLIVGYIPKTVGFIAKRELLLIPILNIWMKAVHCTFINRADRRQAVKTIQKGVEQIKKGHPMVIFPEGTRSRGDAMGPFKSGSLKLAIRSDALIVPVTIDGSYKLKEARGVMTPASVKLFIHPPIDAAPLHDEDSKELAERLWGIINEPLKKK